MIEYPELEPAPHKPDPPKQKRAPEKIRCTGSECMKISRAGLLKAPSMFPRDGRMRDGRKPECRVCEAAKPRRKRAPGGTKVAISIPSNKNAVLDDAAARVYQQVGEILAEDTALTNQVKLIKPDVFAAVIAQRRDLYAISGLDAVYDLAMMRVTDNSFMMQVKLLAAKTLIALRDDVAGEKARDGQPMDALLAELNQSFHANSQRIKTVRQTTTEMTVGPEPRVVGE